jgi:hypothetical protein
MHASRTPPCPLPRHIKHVCMKDGRGALNLQWSRHIHHLNIIMHHYIYDITIINLNQKAKRCHHAMCCVRVLKTQALHFITYTRTVILSEDFVVRFSFYFKSCVIGSVSANNYSPWQTAAPSITMTSSTRTPPENPRIIALFDVDGTLTIPRGEITEEMMDFMKALGKKITGTCMIACVVGWHNRVVTYSLTCILLYYSRHCRW